MPTRFSAEHVPYISQSRVRVAGGLRDGRPRAPGRQGHAGGRLVEATRAGPVSGASSSVTTCRASEIRRSASRRLRQCFMAPREAGYHPLAGAVRALGGATLPGSSRLGELDSNWACTPGGIGFASGRPAPDSTPALTCGPRGWRRQSLTFGSVYSCKFASKPGSPPVPLSGRGVLRVVVSSVVVLLVSACSKGTAAKAGGKSDAVVPVQVEQVREESVRRTIEVVGTLAPTTRSRFRPKPTAGSAASLADLGDRVSAGQVLIQLDREKQQYNLEQQKAALARALAQYGATGSEHLPRRSRRRPTCRRRRPSSCRPSRPSTAPRSCIKRQLVPKQTLDDARPTLQAKQAGYDSVAAERQEPARRASRPPRRR